jgi:hypothetical protein
MLPIPSFSGHALREHGRSTGRRPPVLQARSRLRARLFRFSESCQVMVWLLVHFLFAALAETISYSSVAIHPQFTICRSLLFIVLASWHIGSLQTGACL